jgi:hypothetical protein
MSGKGAERFTSPGIAVVCAAMMIAIAFRPQLALPLLALTELFVAGGCARFVVISLRHTEPAPASVALFVVLTLFWAGIAGLSVWWYVQG